MAINLFFYINILIQFDQLLFVYFIFMTYTVKRTEVKINK